MASAFTTATWISQTRWQNMTRNATNGQQQNNIHAEPLQQMHYGERDREKEGTTHIHKFNSMTTRMFINLNYF